MAKQKNYTRQLAFRRWGPCPSGFFSASAVIPRQKTHPYSANNGLNSKAFGGGVTRWQMKYVPNPSENQFHAQDPFVRSTTA